ncbi:unnamed protein product [Albugo candida]|uniref:Uncharacterized protein n=1 Tax=Albugo candida TaxID=65357 RepID=A0A024G8G8_9STRA|nr:unnamed protein product [Albugo candida]|eukprot:CCI43048.1 unnamed protein product [Albugo candida]
MQLKTVRFSHSESRFAFQPETDEMRINGIIHGFQLLKKKRLEVSVRLLAVYLRLAFSCYAFVHSLQLRKAPSAFVCILKKASVTSSLCSKSVPTSCGFLPSHCVKNFCRKLFGAIQKRSQKMVYSKNELTEGGCVPDISDCVKHGDGPTGISNCLLHVENIFGFLVSRAFLVLCFFFGISFGLKKANLSTRYQNGKIADLFFDGK